MDDLTIIKLVAAGAVLIMVIFAFYCQTISKKGRLTEEEFERRMKEMREEKEKK